MSRLAMYRPQLKLSLPFCPEQSRWFHPRQAEEEKTGSVREQQNHRWAGWCSGCRRKVFSLLRCGWLSLSAQLCGRRGLPSWWAEP